MEGVANAPTLALKSLMTTKTNVSHTPTPWIAEGTSIHQEGWDEATMICPIIRSKEDAAFIVRAVNAHEDLLEACKQAMSLLSRDVSGEAIPVFNQLVQAIAKAEGR